MIALLMLLVAQAFVTTMDNSSAEVFLLVSANAPIVAGMPVGPGWQQYGVRLPLHQLQDGALTQCEGRGSGFLVQITLKRTRASVEATIEGGSPIKVMLPMDSDATLLFGQFVAHVAVLSKGIPTWWPANQKSLEGCRIKP